LPSSLKKDPFHPHHGALRNRLDDIKLGQIFLKVRLLHEQGSRASIKAVGVEVADSGPGFEWQSHMAKPNMPEPGKPCGRGLALINMIAGPLSFNDIGNTLSFVLPCLDNKGLRPAAQSSAVF
jgi:hypothetical protein